MSYDNLPIIFAFQKLVYKTTFVLARLSKISQTSWDPFFGHMKFILWTKNGPIWGLPFSTKNLWLVWMIRTFLCNDLTLMNDSPQYLGKYFNLNYVKVNLNFYFNMVYLSTTVIALFSLHWNIKFQQVFSPLQCIFACN